MEPKTPNIISVLDIIYSINIHSRRVLHIILYNPLNQQTTLAGRQTHAVVASAATLFSKTKRKTAESMLQKIKLHQAFFPIIDNKFNFRIS